VLKRFFMSLGVLVRREELPREDPPHREPKPSFISMVLQPEKLPPPAVSVPPRRTPLWRWLLMPEKLPAAEAKGEGGAARSLFATLFAKERLPRDPVPERKSRSRPEGGAKEAGAEGKTASGREK
jgi:hypothetical protein